MPRAARRKSESNIYHVMVRGIDQQKIFADKEDYNKFMDILDRYRQKIAYEIYAYCLMGNHIHLLIKEGTEPLSNTMKRIGTSYVYWYNWQHGRKGHLFQDRYKSEPVDDDAYFLTVLRYIHQNPVKAGLTTNIESYKWTSYMEYTTEAKMVNTNFALAMFDKDTVKAKKMFTKFNKEPNNDKCLEVSRQKKTFSDKEIMQLVLHKYNLEITSLNHEPLKTQLEVLKYLKELDGTSLRQLSRLTGITVNKVFRA